MQDREAAIQGMTLAVTEWRDEMEEWYAKDPKRKAEAEEWYRIVKERIKGNEGPAG